MRIAQFKPVCVALMICFILLPANPAGVPPLNLAELTDAADLIVIGMTEDIHEVSSDETLEINGQRFRARTMVGKIVVDRTLKGYLDSKTLSFQFRLPTSAAGGIGYREVPDQKYSLLFLRRSSVGLDVANPYYPSFPAVSGVRIEGDTVVDRIVSELGFVIDAAEIPTPDKLSILFALQGINNPLLSEHLKGALHTKDNVLRLSVAAALLQQGDTDALKIATAALLHPPNDVPVYVLRNLASAISRGVAEPRSIPALTQILEQAHEAFARRAAAFALRSIGSPSAVKPLIYALNDSDFEVRYYAVIGLAEITHSDQWRPLMDEFQAHEQLYLAHWQQWARSQ